MTSKTVVIIFITVAIVGLLVMILGPKVIAHIDSYVLFLTLLAILAYSWETHKLSVQSEKQTNLIIQQTELSFKPHLEIVFKRAYFRLYNIGNGPAVHVRIDDKIVSPGGGPERLRFICPPIIKKDECLPIEIKILTEDGQHEDKSAELGFIKPPLATFTEEISVHFENLMGKKYDQELLIGEHMSINIDPVDFLLQYLFEQFERDPRPIHPNEVHHLYVDSKDVMKYARYCRNKGLIDAVDLSSADGEAFDNVRINSKGIDYLKGKD